jgi:hypothetical protein
MSKNKAQKAGTRAKKASARSKDRQIEKAREATKFREKKKHSLEHFTLNPQTGYEFWLIHGSNFLLSSYEQGVWSPAFPEIYEGKTVTRTALFKRVLEAHLDATTNQLSPSGTRTILWCSLKPREMFALVNRAKKFVWAAKGDPVAQGNPEVWHFLYTVMGEFLKGLDASGKTKDGKFLLPVEQYGELLPRALADTASQMSGINGPAEESTPDSDG